MKNKIKIFGIIALTAVIALVIIACDEEEADNSKYYMDPPTGIVATKLPNNYVHLTWNEVSGAQYYEISFRTDMDSADTRRPAGTSTITRYEHYYYSWYVTDGITTLYYYVKTHPSKSGYIAGDWSKPVSVGIN
jgi:hypothetical protein